MRFRVIGIGIGIGNQSSKRMEDRHMERERVIEVLEALVKAVTDGAETLSDIRLAQEALQQLESDSI
jgi:hypothetical protein